MIYKGITACFFLVLWVLSSADADCNCREELMYDPPDAQEKAAIDGILEHLGKSARELESYEGKIEYLFRQPLFDSKTLRTGDLYYEKGDDKSKLRVNFKTLKQDEEKEEKYRDEYIFDGVWLTHIDYGTKHVEVRQLTEPNEPLDAFELVSRNFPIIGFSGKEELEEQFEIRLPEGWDKDAGIVKLDLQVKPASIYKDDYSSVEFSVDNELWLPAKIITTTVEEEIYEISLVKPKINKGIDEKVFEFKIPKGFSKEVFPLEKKG